MVQRIRPLLLLKKQLGAYQRLGVSRYGIGNRTVGKGFRATQISAQVGNDEVTVFFSEDVVVTDPTSGVILQVNGNNATFTAIKGPRSIVYTLTSQVPLDYNDIVEWNYDDGLAGADPYTGADSGEPLADTTLIARLPSAPAPVVTNIQAPDQNTIVVTFNTRVTGSASFGVAWTGLLDPPSASDPVNVNQIVYTLGPQDAGNIYDSSVIRWAYTEATGTLVGAATGIPVPDTSRLVDVSALPPAPIVAPTWIPFALPNVSVGSGWAIDLNDFISDDGGEAPTFTVALGALPAGITLNPDGTFSGTASAESSGSVTFAATNSGGTSNSADTPWQVFANIVAPTWSVITLPDNLPIGSPWNVDLNAELTSTGGEAPTFTLATGTLPQGISLNPNGTFSGVTQQAENNFASFKASNSGGSSDSNEDAWSVIDDSLAIIEGGWTGGEDCGAVSVVHQNIPVTNRGQRVIHHGT